MSEQDQVSESAVLPRVSVMLVEARTAMGLSQKEVADQLFLTTTFIRYMDEGQFHLISKTAYIKGYLRTYARVVGLSGDEVVAGYEETIEARVEPFEMRDVAEEPVSANRFTGPVIQTGVIGLGALLLVVLLVWLFSGDDETEARGTSATNSFETADVASNDFSDETTTSTPTKPSSLPDRAELDGSEVSAAPVVASGLLSNDDTPNYALPSTPLSNKRGVAVTKASIEVDQGLASSIEKKDIESRSVVDVENAFSASATPLVPTADGVASSTVEAPAVAVTIENLGQGLGSVITVTAAGDDKLEFSFSDECWVEVTDAMGESIYGDLNRIGDSLIVYGTAPFEVLFGKAPAAQLVFNGEPFALSRFTSADLTAKVKLGR